MEILIFALIIFVVYKVVKGNKKSTSANSNTTGFVGNNEDQLAKTINQLREARKKQEEQKITSLQTDVNEKRGQLNYNNSEADKMGLRQSLCFIVSETVHWHAWKDNTEDFVEKYTDIDDFIFNNASSKKVGDRDSRFELDFIFNGKKYQFAHQTKGSFDGTNFGFVEIFEQNGDEFEKMVKMDTYMTYGEYTNSYTPGDISLYKIGEWIPMIVSVDAGLQAISKKVSLQFNKMMLDKKFTGD